MVQHFPIKLNFLLAQKGKSIPENCDVFKIFGIHTYESLFYSVCLKGLYKYKILSEI